MDRNRQLLHAVRLEQFSLAWMAVEAVVALAAGWQARSLALTGFGADSLIELLSAALLLGRLSHEQQAGEDEPGGDLERTTTWLAAVLLGTLTFYLLVTGLAGIWLGSDVLPSPAGVAVTALASVVMVFLARAKRHSGEVLDMPALKADGVENRVCAYMSMAALVSALLVWTLHWRWTDPLAALFLAYWVGQEARETVREARARFIGPGA